MQKRKIATLSVLPTLDWAAEISQQEEVTVVSGFHSRMERGTEDPASRQVWPYCVHIHTLQAEKVIQKQWYDSDITNLWISMMRNQVLLDYAMQGERRQI